MKNDLITTIELTIGKQAWKDIHRELFYGEDPSDSGYEDEMLVLSQNGYVIKKEDHYGGEGKGDEYWSVFSVTRSGETKYFKIHGWYASHHGPSINGDAYDFFEVEKIPVQTYKWSTKRNEI